MTNRNISTPVVLQKIHVLNSKINCLSNEIDRLEHEITSSDVGKLNEAVFGDDVKPGLQKIVVDGYDEKGGRVNGLQIRVKRLEDTEIGDLTDLDEAVFGDDDEHVMVSGQCLMGSVYGPLVTGTRSGGLVDVVGDSNSGLVKIVGTPESGVNDSLCKRVSALEQGGGVDLSALNNAVFGDEENPGLQKYVVEGYDDGTGTYVNGLNNVVIDGYVKDGVYINGLQKRVEDLEQGSGSKYHGIDSQVSWLALIRFVEDTGSDFTYDKYRAVLRADNKVLTGVERTEDMIQHINGIRSKSYPKEGGDPTFTEGLAEVTFWDEVKLVGHDKTNHFITRNYKIQVHKKGEPEDNEYWYDLEDNDKGEFTVVDSYVFPSLSKAVGDPIIIYEKTGIRYYDTFETTFDADNKPQLPTSGTFILKRVKNDNETTDPDYYLTGNKNEGYSQECLVTASNVTVTVLGHVTRYIEVAVVSPISY